MHMGLSLEGRGWGCWRNQQHRGKNPTRLIAALLGVSQVDAGRMAGTVPTLREGADDVLQAVLTGLKKIGTDVVVNTVLTWSKDIQPLRCGSLAEDYLRSRGYDRHQMEYLVKHFRLREALVGEYRYRLVIPVYDIKDRLYTWTGRAINESAKLRYKTLSPRDDPPARGPITDMLLDLPHLTGERMLIICEGPFDAMNLSYYTPGLKTHVTCLFGKTVSDSQVDKVIYLSALYDNIVLLLDPDAAFDGLSLQRRFSPVKVRIHWLRGDKDPGEMNAKEALRLLLEISDIAKRDKAS